MAFQLRSRSFSYIMEQFTRFYNTNILKKINEDVPILNNNNSNIQPTFNTETKMKLSTSIFLKYSTAVKFDTNILPSESLNRFISLSHKSSMSFWRKSPHFPIKCKIKINDFGEKIAKPYIAKNPTPNDLEHFSKDFILKKDNKCEKPQGKALQCISVSEMEPKLTENVELPSAHNKFSQKQVFAKENSCTRNTKYTFPSESKENKSKKIVSNLMSTLKLMKQSGFIGGEFITEKINQLRLHFTAKNRNLYDLATVNQTSSSIEMQNFEKSLARKFGGQSKSKQFPIQKNFTAAILFNRITEEESSNCSKILSARSNSSVERAKENMNRNNRSLVKLKKTEDHDVQSKRDELTKSYGDTLPIQREISTSFSSVKKKNKKLRKRTTYKPKSRHGVRLGKRKRKFSFSKIPIQPNVKGSVIFVNETTQPLEDPCKILSVNFFKNDDMVTSNEGTKKKDDVTDYHTTVVGQFTAVKAKSNGFIKNSELKKIPIKAKIFQGFSEDRRDLVKEKLEDGLKTEGKKKQYSEGEVLVNLRTKKYDNSPIKEERYYRTNSPPEPIIRRKKISKLDKNITSFVTTVFPEEKLSKSLSKFKKNKSFPEQFGFINLDSEGKEISTNVMLGGRNDEMDKLKEQEKPKSVSSIGSDFYRKIAEVPNFKSEAEMKKNETAEPKGKKLSADKSKRENSGFKKGITVSPGLTRPVTQKTAYLDILKTKPFTPISNMWKNSAASTGRIPSSKKKNGKKKAIRSTNNLNSVESKHHNLQQIRHKSTTSWKSKCECEEKPCLTKKKDYDGTDNRPNPLPVDWDYEGAAPSELARKWATTECPQEKEMECPVTSEDIKRGPPCRRPLSAAALNRCNYNECRNRMRSKKFKCGRRGNKKTIEAGC